MSDLSVYSCTSCGWHFEPGCIAGEQDVGPLSKRECPQCGWKWADRPLRGGDLDKEWLDFDGLTKRVQALERLTALFSLEGPDGLEKRVAAIEALLKPVDPETVAVSRSDRSILFAPVLFEKAELEGLDLPGFKTLLRERFAEIGDELVTAFLNRETSDE